MGQTFLIVLGMVYSIYRVAYVMPKNIKRNEEKIDRLDGRLNEIDLKLIQIIKKIEQ